jgi:hypothetical protein
MHAKLLPKPCQRDLPSNNQHKQSSCNSSPLAKPQTLIPCTTTTSSNLLVVHVRAISCKLLSANNMTRYAYSSSHPRPHTTTFSSFACCTPMCLRYKYRYLLLIYMPMSRPQPLICVLFHQLTQKNCLAAVVPHSARLWLCSAALQNSLQCSAQANLLTTLRLSAHPMGRSAHCGLIAGHEHLTVLAAAAPTACLNRGPTQGGHSGHCELLAEVLAIKPQG